MTTAFAVVMTLAINWRIADRSDAPSVFPILAWQMLVWVPWVFLFFVTRRIATMTNSMKAPIAVRWVIHGIAAFAVAGVHLTWFWQVSRHLSPLIGLPSTKYGAYAFFFVFWFLFDLVFCFAVQTGTQTQRQDPVKVPAYKQHFSVRKGRTRRMVRVADIVWIEAQGYYAALHTESETFLIRRSLAVLETELDPAYFLRIHRSTIVNIKCVGGIQRDGNNGHIALMESGRRHKISRARRNRLESALGFRQY
ncbi:MAG: LytTR family DNA-binding domain-containing protein [Pseudomonadota bacterium]